MKRNSLWAIGMMLLVAYAALGQQSKAVPGQHATQSGAPIVEKQLKSLTAQFDLTSDQQARFKPILQELHEATEKLIRDKALSHDERLGKARPQFDKADKQMREILTGDQQKKLDQFEQEPHPEMHGGLN